MIFFAGCKKNWHPLEGFDGLQGHFLLSGEIDLVKLIDSG
jgi:hypothetical protein